MSHLVGESREQIRLLSLEDCIPEESMVRVIDRFIELQDFDVLGFQNVVPAETGRPSYPPKPLTKLYVYGYENGIRSSRKLERETLRNLEVMWLMNELMGNNRGGVDVCYNVQSAADGKHHIVTNFDVITSPVDHGQLGRMVKRVQKTLRIRQFYALADKGYYNGKDLQRCKRYKVRTIVSKQKGSDPKDQPEQFHNDKFAYNKEADTYTCPAGKTLHPHNKKTAKRRNFFNKTACGECSHRDQCTTGERSYRTIARGQYGDIYDEVDKRTKENMELYRLRQQIVEHPFGTVKHTMNGYYFLLRRRRKVRTEVALLFLGYNLKRAYNVLGFREIMARLDAISVRFSAFFRIFRVFFIIPGCRTKTSR